jgi:hypothetical protein
MKGRPMKLRHILAQAVLIPLCFTLSNTGHAQSDVTKSVLDELTARIQGLENACGDDIKKYCSAVTPGGGHIVNCLQAYDDKISAQCSFSLDEVEIDFREVTDKLKEAVQSCQGDIEKLCSKTQPGQGRISACLAASSASITSSCTQAIEKLRPKTTP